MDLSPEKIDKMIEILQSIKDGKIMEGRVFVNGGECWKKILDINLNYTTLDEDERLYSGNVGYTKIREREMPKYSQLDWDQLIQLSMNKTKIMKADDTECREFTITGIHPSRGEVGLQGEICTHYVKVSSLAKLYVYASDMTPVGNADL